VHASVPKEQRGEGGDASRNQAGLSKQPHLPPFICHAPAEAGQGHPHNSGITEPQERDDHQDLNTRAQAARSGCADLPILCSNTNIWFADPRTDVTIVAPLPETLCCH
jgi:hypothetical protein